MADIPQTGDDFDPALTGALCGASFAGLMSIAAYSVRSRRKRLVRLGRARASAGKPNSGGA
jgi:hypothetical protein